MESRVKVAGVALVLAATVLCPGRTGAWERAAAFDPHNGRLLVVHGFKPLQATHDLRARFFAPGGDAAPPDVLIVAAANAPLNPSVAFDTVRGRYLAVWQDGRSSAFRHEIWGQFIGADGTLAGDNFPVVTFPDASLRHPVIGHEPTSGTYFLAWVDDRDYLVTDDDIRGVVLDAEGTPDGGGFVIAGEPWAQTDPALAHDPGRGRVLAVWEDYAAETWPDLRGRLYTAAGAPVADAFAIADSATMQYAPSAAYDAAHDRFLVSWLEADTAYSEEGDVRARLLSGEGSVLGSEIVVSNAAGEQTTPAAAFDAAGDRWLVAWSDWHDVRGPDIRGQYLDASGTPVGSATNANFPVAESAATDEHDPLVFYDPGCQRVGVAYMDWDGLASEDTPRFVTIGGPCAPPATKVTAPNGGERIASGSTGEITWTPPAGAAAALVEYSLDGGVSWLPANGAGDADSFAWRVPRPWGNVRRARVRVTARDASGASLGSDESDADFTLEVVRMRSPAPGAVLASGGRARVSWTTNATRRPVAAAVLRWSLDGGATWLPLATLPGNPGSFAWQLPEVGRARTRCLVRVVLRGRDGRRLGKDDGDAAFTLLP